MSTVSTNLYDSGEAAVLKRRAAAMGLDVTSMALMTSRNGVDAVADQMGLELGINKTTDEHNLSFDSFVKSSTSENNLLFQGEDGMLSNLNFNTMEVSQQSEADFAKENGMINDEGDKFYDVVDFGQNKAEFVDYSFEGTGDGKADTTPVSVANQDWTSVKWVRQEVDQTTWGTGATDPISTKSNEAFQTIFRRRNQWLSATQKAQLLRVDSWDAYLQKLAEFAVKDMDETGTKEY